MNREHWGRQFGPALLFAVLALFCCSGLASAQYVKDLPPPPPLPIPKPTPTPALKDEDFDVIRVSSNLVMVPVSVVNASGQAVHGLPVSDFRLEEEGRIQQIVEVGNPDQVPLDIAILFDISSTVSQKGFFGFQQRAAAGFLRQVMKPTDQAAVFTIGAESQMVSPLGSAETAAARLSALTAATSPVSTSFYDTVVAASKYLDENSLARRRKVIVVITDGEDTSSSFIQETMAEIRANQRVEASRATSREKLQLQHRRAVTEVQKVVQKSDAAFYSINPGGPSIHLNDMSTRAQRGMESIAQSTGGTAFVPDGEKDLEKVFNEVAAELRGQYLLQYYSNAQMPGTQFRRIVVAVPTHTDLRVRARQGYYPKK
ncbi:MAG: VWA domain-containing protein [Pyrinomonadaceae bacterium]|nr:VWA domain-containing protein [Pyrinomonadaceae bacterium]